MDSAAAEAPRDNNVTAISTTSCGELSSAHICRQSRNQSVWCWTTTRGLMGQLFCPGQEESLWPGMWLYQTHYAESHIANTAITPGAAAHTSAQKTTDKYAELSKTHVFYPFAVETAGVWHEMATELTQEIGRRITTVTEDTRETTFLFQRLSMALQRGNAVAFWNTMITEWNAVASITHFSYSNIIMPAALWAKIIIIIREFIRRRNMSIKSLQGGRTLRYSNLCWIIWLYRE